MGQVGPDVIEDAVVSQKLTDEAGEPGLVIETKEPAATSETVVETPETYTIKAI
jgi:hypothetical protein